MNDRPLPFPEETLNRWVDGRLDAARAAEIEAAMRNDPALAETLRNWRTQRDALRSLGTEWLDEPVPPSMIDRLRAAARMAGDAPRADSGGSGGTGMPGTADRFGEDRRADERARADSAVAWRIAASVAIAGAALLGFALGRVSAPTPTADARPAPAPVVAAAPASAPATAPSTTTAPTTATAPGTATAPAPAPAPTTSPSPSPSPTPTPTPTPSPTPMLTTAPTPTPTVPSPDAPPGFVRAAATAHAVFVPEVRHPVEVGGGDRGHLVAWLSKRLGTPLVAPDLVDQGFELVGGRLLAGDSGPTAQLMYQDAQGVRITLYVARRDVEAATTTTATGAAGAASADTAFRFERSGDLQSFYWIDREVGYVLSGEVPRERLSALATEVHRALDAQPR